MVWRNKWMIMLLNTILGGGYITVILLLIQWVSTGHLGIAAFFVPIGIMILVTLGWTIVDKRKCVTSNRLMKQMNG